MVSVDNCSSTLGVNTACVPTRIFSAALEPDRTSFKGRQMLQLFGRGECL